MRLIDMGPCSAAENMGVDEALFLSLGPEQDLPVLRLYGWQRPCVSLGYSQKAGDAVKLSSCREQGVDIVRRITGGRAVLHHQEVTYSLFGSVQTGPFAGPLLECCRSIAQCLIWGCERLGLSRDALEVAADRDRGRAPQISSACFLIHSASEVMASGRKLIGSAQKRGRNVFLQHGSIPLRIDHGLLLSVLSVEREHEKEGKGAGVGPACLEGVLGRALTNEQVKAAIVQGFAEWLGTTSVEPTGLTPMERELADSLVQVKYQTRAWTYRR